MHHGLCDSIIWTVQIGKCIETKQISGTKCRADLSRAGGENVKGQLMGTSPFGVSKQKLRCRSYNSVNILKPLNCIL